jgi:hypothetical protein
MEIEIENWAEFSSEMNISISAAFRSQARHGGTPFPNLFLVSLSKLQCRFSLLTGLPIGPSPEHIFVIT